MMGVWMTPVQLRCTTQLREYRRGRSAPVREVPLWLRRLDQSGSGCRTLMFLSQRCSGLESRADSLACRRFSGGFNCCGDVFVQ